MKYKVGDKVKIKTWDAMKKEFGRYDYAGIQVKDTCSYVDDMENQMPSNRIVEIEAIEADGLSYSSHFCKGGDHWFLCDEMIEGKVYSVSPRMKAFKKRPYRNAVK